MDELKFPVGKFQFPAEIGEEQRVLWIDQVATAPARLREAVAGLTPEQLDTPYRPGGWTVRQVVHHVADSHINCYIRFRMALTEDTPTIKTYSEDQWAQLADARTAPVESSLVLLDSLHTRWVTLMRSLGPAEFARQFHHPELGKLSLEVTLAIYAWHGRHHVAHITSLSERQGWR